LTDPEFANARRIYEIRYVISGALVPQGSDYVLEHDLAFPDRPAEIRIFDATLQIDPAWQPTGSVDTTFHREHVRPGEGVFVTALLHYVGAGTPSAVASAGLIPSAAATPWLRYALLIVAIAFAALQARALLSRDRRIGRFEPQVPLDQIDESWLQANVFNRLPEEVGAAWDLNTSASEVAALLARLVLEGKLKSEVRVEGKAFSKREALYLELLCERSALAVHERSLIDALFLGGGRFTNTDTIRKHYEKSGFNPAALLKAAIEKRLPMIFANRIAVPAWTKWLTAALLILGAASVIMSGIRAPDTLPVALGVAAVLLVSYLIGAIFAYSYSRNVHDLRERLVRALACAAVLTAILAFVLAAGQLAFLPLQLIGLTLFTLGLMNSLFNAMRARETSEALQLRRVLGSARRYFERELAAKNPKLKDEWFPYLLAFGLGPKVDQWFRAYGADTTNQFAEGATQTSASPSPAATSSSAWTGGGGTFGGAGASGSWAAAAGSIAAGVTAASSDSSSGGSSGGGGSSSSGGGGGGGW
jgi:uncharacterized membrane protein YgcG